MATEREELRRLAEKGCDCCFSHHGLPIPPYKHQSNCGLLAAATPKAILALLADLDASEEAKAVLAKALRQALDLSEQVWDAAGVVVSAGGVSGVMSRHLQPQISRLPKFISEGHEVLAAAKAAPHALRDAIRDAVVLISDLLSETDPDEDGWNV